MWVSGVGCFIFYVLGLLIEFFIFSASQIFCIRLHMNNSNNNKKPCIILLVHRFWRLAWVIWWHVDWPAECAGAPRMWQPGQTSLPRGSPSSPLPGTGWLWPQDIMFPEKGKKDAWFSAETPSMGEHLLLWYLLMFRVEKFESASQSSSQLPPHPQLSPSPQHSLEGFSCAPEAEMGAPGSVLAEPTEPHVTAAPVRTRFVSVCIPPLVEKRCRHRRLWQMLVNLAIVL